MKKLEPLIGFWVEDDRVIFQVWSSGCTAKDSFDLDPVDFGCKTPRIELYRVVEDTCKMKPHPVKIEYTLKEAGLADVAGQFVVVNPFCGSAFPVA